jgi:hypothetical protein
MTSLLSGLGGYFIGLVWCIGIAAIEDHDYSQHGMPMQFRWAQRRRWMVVGLLWPIAAIVFTVVVVRCICHGPYDDKY